MAMKMLAEEYMIPLDMYPRVLHTSSLDETLQKIESVQIEVGKRKSLPRHALVFNESGQLLGLVRRRDILRGLDPEYLTGITLARRGSKVDEKLVAGIRKNATRPVSDVMFPMTVTVNHDDHVVKIIDLMVEHDLTLIPVLRDGEVVGVVRTVDVCDEIARLLRE